MLKLQPILHGSLKIAQISAATLYKRLSQNTWGYKGFSEHSFIRPKWDMVSSTMPSLLHLPSFPLLLQLTVVRSCSAPHSVSSAWRCQTSRNHIHPIMRTSLSQISVQMSISALPSRYASITALLFLDSTSNYLKLSFLPIIYMYILLPFLEYEL